MEICQLQQDRLQLAATERRSQPNKDHSWRQQLTNWQRLWNDNRKSVNDQAPANQYNINTRWKVLGNGLKGFLPRHADETTRVFAYKIEQLPGKPNQTLKNTREGRRPRRCIHQMRSQDVWFIARRNYSPDTARGKARKSWLLPKW